MSHEELLGGLFVLIALVVLVELLRQLWRSP